MYNPLDLPSGQELREGGLLRDAACIAQRIVAYRYEYLEPNESRLIGGEETTTASSASVYLVTGGRAGGSYNPYHMHRQRSVTVIVWALVVTLVSAQITFSRDWTGGKRAPAPLDCAQFTRLCRQFVHEMKTSMAVPAFDKHRRPDSDDNYDDK